MTDPVELDMNRIRYAMWLGGVPLEAKRQEWLAEVRAEILDRGGHLCGTLTRTGAECGREAIHLYGTGWKCPRHTPAAQAGRPEPAPDPARTMEGLRRAWYEERGLPYVEQHTPAGPTVIDQKAIASGKRRSSPSDFRAARAAMERNR